MIRRSLNWTPKQKRSKEIKIDSFSRWSEAWLALTVTVGRSKTLHDKIMYLVHHHQYIYSLSLAYTWKSVYEFDLTIRRQVSHYGDYGSLLKMRDHEARLILTPKELKTGKSQDNAKQKSSSTKSRQRHRRGVDADGNRVCDKHIRGVCKAGTVEQPQTCRYSHKPITKFDSYVFDSAKTISRAASDLTDLDPHPRLLGSDDELVDDHEGGAWASVIDWGQYLLDHRRRQYLEELNKIRCVQPKLRLEGWTAFMEDWANKSELDSMIELIKQGSNLRYSGPRNIVRDCGSKWPGDKRIRKLLKL